MHEFAIAQSIIEITLKSAEEHRVDVIKLVEVEIGLAAGVEISALEFAWESATRDTALANTSLEIIKIPVEVSCRSCRFVYMPEDVFELCPNCGSVDPEIIKGRELRVVAIVT
jgi:hydrogenase nickel incorporation protein HypA/HybF